ncbi:MAG: sialidase-1 [Rhodothermales bacterium]|jgi:sialidase-1
MRRNVSDMVKKENWRWYATGPCSGIQIKAGKYKGRLVMPANHSLHPSDGTSWTYLCHSLYSDDHGETWQIGDSSEPGASETQIAEVSEDLLIQDIRMQTHRRGLRAVRFSKDGGDSWTPLEHHKNRPDPKCQGSIISDGNYLISANPASWGRDTMTVYASSDGGKSWPDRRLIYSGPSAYSDLEVSDGGNVICLYEAGIRHPYEGIAVASFPKSTLIKEALGEK